MRNICHKELLSTIDVHKGGKHLLQKSCVEISKSVGQCLSKLEEWRKAIDFQGLEDIHFREILGYIVEDGKC